MQRIHIILFTEMCNDNFEILNISQHKIEYISYNIVQSMARLRIVIMHKVVETIQFINIVSFLYS